MAFSPLKIWLSLEAGRAILVANSSLIIPSSPMTSSRYSPGGMARSECATDSVLIVFAHPLDHNDFEPIALQRENQPLVPCKIDRPLALASPFELVTPE